MSEFPLYDMMESYPSISPVSEYLRDRNCPPGYVEARRKADLRAALNEFKTGQLHTLLLLMRSLDSTLISSRHGLHHLASLARDQTSFKDHYGRPKKEGDPPPPEEEFQKKRRAHIERLISESLSYGYRSFGSGMDARWSDELLETLDQPETRAIDIVERIAVRIVSSDNRYRSEELSRDIKTHRHNQQRDELVHANDPYIEGDLVQIMAAHGELSWRDSNVRDQYQTQSAIEIRRAEEIIDALEAWKGGQHPLLVMSDILKAVVENLEHRYRHMFGEAKSALGREKSARRENVSGKHDIYSEHSLVSSLLDQEKLRRQAKDIMRQMHQHVVAYRGPESNPEFAAALDAHIQALVDTPQSSFFVLEGIGLAMFGDESEELKGIRVDLREVREKEEKERKANAPMGGLKTQNEAEMKERLTEVFDARARPEPRPEILTREIRIEAVGAGMIKPFRSREDDAHWEEEIYGTVTASITTYNVVLVPISPDKLEALAKRVTTTLAEIADVEPAFEIPFDRAAQPYERPYKKGRYDPDYRYYSSESMRVNVENGVVKVWTRLDLDDLWNLYYLMEDAIEPSAQIAAAMNGARYAEARGFIMTLGDTEPGNYRFRDNQYSNEHLRPEERLGLLDYHRADEYVPGMMQDTFGLYAIGEIGDEQFLHRVIVLADHTLTGKLLDVSGAFPSYQRLTSRQSEQAGQVTTYADALKDRARSILKRMAGVEGDTDDLMAALKRRISTMGEGIREAMRAEAYATEDRHHERMIKSFGGSGKTLDQTWKEIQSQFKEETGEDLDKVMEAKAQKTPEELRDLTRRCNLAFHAGEVGATTDRTWRGTKYVSRSPGSIWVRKDMPSALAPFVAPSQRDMGQAMLAIAGQSVK